MVPMRFLASLSIALALVLPAKAERYFTFDTTPSGLPKDVRPIAYRIDLDLVPDLDGFDSVDGSQPLGFKGKVEIDIDVLRATETITFNTVDLNVSIVSVDGIKAILDRRDDKTATYRVPKKLARGSHSVSISYTGN